MRDGWSAFFALLAFIAGFLVGGGILSDAYRDEAKTGYLVINKQAYRIIPVQAQ